MRNQTEFTIIGGGVAGLTAAIALQNLGREYQLFEQAEELKGIGAGFGLAANAMHALDLLGLRDEVEKYGYYLDSFAILDQKGNVLADPNTKDISAKYKQRNFAIHRADLHLYLLSKINQEHLFLGKRALTLEQDQDGVTIHFQDGTQQHSKYLIIADGVKSPLRQFLVPNATPRYAGYSCWRATIDNSQIKLKKGTETWGKSGRFGMTPLINDRIYWYACINGPQQNPTFKHYTIDDLARVFRNYHDPIPALLDNTRNEDLIWSDIIDLKPLDHLAYGRVLIIGDAGHACTPNMGQGACQAIEDVAVLVDELQQPKAVMDAFAAFERRRKSRVKYITDTSKFIGEVAQWENPALISLRNLIMKVTPNRINQRALDRLFKQDFMTLNKN